MCPSFIEVAAGIIIHHNRVLIGQRDKTSPLAGKWEFPGGRIEWDEGAREALERELMEEVGVRARIGEQLIVVEYPYDVGTVRLHVFIAEILSGELKVRAHERLEWVRPEELVNFDLAEADRLVVPHLVLYLKQTRT